MLYVLNYLQLHSLSGCQKATTHEMPFAEYKCFEKGHLQFMVYRFAFLSFMLPYLSILDQKLM